MSRRLSELVPERPEPLPRGLFYVAHLALELVKRIESRSIFVLPGGVVFFFLLGLLPAAAAVASLYGLFADPGELVGLSAKLATMLPQVAADLIADALQRVAATPSSSLGFSAVVALFMTLMSANWGTKALCEALNIVFDRREERGYLEFTGVTLLITTLTAAIAGCYAWLHFRLASAPLAADFAPTFADFCEILSIAALLTVIIGSIYRLGAAPQAGREPIPVLSVGAMTAAVSVVIISWLLSRQLTNTATFVRNFGPLASVAAVVVWGWGITVAILIGAEIVEIRSEEARQRETPRRWPFFKRRVLR